MTCDEISRLFPEYLIGELPERTIREAQDHIAVCPRCASHLAFMESVARRISVRPVDPPSDSYFSRFPGEVMRKIQRVTSGPATQGHSHYIHRALYTSVAAAAAALLIFFVWPAQRIIGPGHAGRPGAGVHTVAVTASPEEELSHEIASIDLPDTDGTLDLLYGAEPWEALPDISDAEWIEVLSELSRESSG